MSNINTNARFAYTATGTDKDGHHVEFGGEAKTLGDAIGGVFGHDDVAVTDWSAEQFVDYWKIVVCGSKGGKDGKEICFTFKDPKQSSALVTGICAGFDYVRSAHVSKHHATRKAVDDLLEQNKEDWI